MNRQPYVSITHVFLLLACLVACTGVPPATQQPTIPTDTPTSEPTATKAPPYCPSAASYGQIWEHWPSEFHIESTTPTFTWFYSIRGVSMPNLEDWEHVCVPESYTIHLSSGPGYDDEILIPVENPSVVPDSGKLTMEWSSNVALEPFKDYRWYVVGHAGEFTIDDWGLIHLHNDTWWPPRSTYFKSVFRTGPECAPGAISIPQLSFPAEGTVLQTLNPVLTWEVGNCMPLVFRVEISTMRTFENPQNVVVPIPPGDYSAVRQSDYPWMYVEYILRDCTSFYWRVTGGLGACRPAVEGCREWGAPSEIQSFSVNLGNCATPTPTRTRTPIPPTRTPTQENTPTAVPVSCTGLDESQCKITPGCEWYISAASAPYCRAKP